MSNLDTYRQLLRETDKFLELSEKAKIKQQRLVNNYITEDKDTEELKQKALKLSSKDIPVLIEGETGTGKELIAKILHGVGRIGPLVTINCAGIPSELLESEFFGHVRGAFTGAVKDRAGHFISAQSGTLFLDEIGELPLQLQSKLLRAIEYKTFTPVGSSDTVTYDCRIIAATNRQLLSSPDFRQDLYYRLAVVKLQTKPLRDRKQDIPLLIEKFISKYKLEPSEYKEIYNTLPPDTYTWPGNIRELKNFVDAWVALNT